MGAPDPRLDSSSNIDFRITRQLSCYAKADPPPNRVKPVPVAVLRRIMVIAAASNCPFVQCLADMICLGFFFLLRPGEYTDSPSDSMPFTFDAAQLFRSALRLHLLLATEAELLTATFGSLTFDRQKNAVRGEVIGQAHSGDPLLSPTKAIARRIIHLRQHNAPPKTPLCQAYTSPTTTRSVKPSDITQSLQLAVAYLGPSLGFLPSDVTARCLRAAGANALLCAGIDTDIIRLLGRWKSDEMLRYLHTQAGPVLRDFSRRMLSGGAFTLIPNQAVPSF